MLELIDSSLEALFRAAVPLSATDIDVSFEPPDREWSAKLTRPTVNLFLWDIRRSAGRSRSGIRTTERNGTTVHEPAAPVVELRYVVTAWTSDHGDERALLGGLVRTLLANPTIPRDLLTPAYDRFDPPALMMARAGEDHMDVFKALEGQLKPGVNMIVATEFDAGLGLATGPPVGSIGIAVGRVGEPPEPVRRRIAGEIDAADTMGAVGAVVRSPGDATIVNAAGRFLLRAAPGDEVVVETDPPLVATVPATGGIRFGGHE